MVLPPYTTKRSNMKKGPFSHFALQPRRRLLAVSLSACILGACSSNDSSQRRATLADVDTHEGQTTVTAKRKPVSRSDTADVREAYRKYIDSASTDERSRQEALTRLAELELELSKALLRDSSDTDDEITPAFKQSLERTIVLLETSLRDYPNAKDNDRVMYQLSQSYDQVGRYQDSIVTLESLSARYPTSLYYPEAQFRIAEGAFARGDYITAEDAYTEVILTPGSDKFYEKSLFKRGWTRYKQQLFLEALDDYVKAFNLHGFQDTENLTGSEKTQFDEYIRALGLAFSYQRDGGAIQEYFAEQGTFKYLYNIYENVSDIYLKQERYSDSAEILEQYIDYYDLTENSPRAELKIINAWQKGGFYTNLYASIERFYDHYQPDAAFWQTNGTEETQKLVDENLRGYIVQVTSFFHEQYQKKPKQENFFQAQSWYERYLKHYSAYANQDNIYSLYAELLLLAKRDEQAFEYFALAAYDGEIILDKKAAFTTISLSNTMLRDKNRVNERGIWLERYLTYAQRYVELYPEDKRSENTGLSASEAAFEDKRYQQAIDLANYLPDTINERSRFNIDNIKARSYFELAQYADAEAVYFELLNSKYTKRNQRKSIEDSLALSIYRQGEQAQQGGSADIDFAINHFVRIGDKTPASPLASTGLYDAIALAMKNKKWNDTVALTERFKADYPNHELIGDVRKKLSVAYLNSDQKVKAAQEFERIASFEENSEVKRAALWQAAELYEGKNDVDSAIRSYRSYAHAYPTPYEQNMEAMFKLTQLYKKKRDTQKRFFWQAKIQKADLKATKTMKSERTDFLASTTILDLAKQKQSEFNRRKLVEPIAANLKKKKSAMQESVKLFGQASTYGIAEITTEATHSIGEIYKDFSQDLLNSERPKNLNADELEQYEILLEDQAFPFEEKAIEFYEANVSRSQDGTFNDWVEQSFAELIGLFPVRYERKGKLAPYKGD